LTVGCLWEFVFGISPVQFFEFNFKVFEKILVILWSSFKQAWRLFLLQFAKFPFYINNNLSLQQILLHVALSLNFSWLRHTSSYIGFVRVFVGLYHKSGVLQQLCIHTEGNKQNSTLLENESNNLCKPPTYVLKSSLWVHIRNIGLFCYVVLSSIMVSFRPRELQLCVNKIVPQLESLASHLIVLPWRLYESHHSTQFPATSCHTLSSLPTFIWSISILTNFKRC
jgi:hypothetical protein